MIILAFWEECLFICIKQETYASHHPKSASGNKGSLQAVSGKKPLCVRLGDHLQVLRQERHRLVMVVPTLLGKFEPMRMLYAVTLVVNKMRIGVVGKQYHLCLKQAPLMALSPKSVSFFHRLYRLS